MSTWHARVCVCVCISKLVSGFDAKCRACQSRLVSQATCKNPLREVRCKNSRVRHHDESRGKYSVVYSYIHMRRLLAEIMAEEIILSVNPTVMLMWQSPCHTRCRYLFSCWYKQMIYRVKGSSLKSRSPHTLHCFSDILRRCNPP